MSVSLSIGISVQLPPQPDDTDDEDVKIEKLELAKLVKDLKPDISPGESGMERNVLIWFLEFFPIFLPGRGKLLPFCSSET